MSRSLAQYVASVGGISMRDPALQGETDRLRAFNTTLRGRNSIVRTDGRAVDIVAQSCIDEGYPITEMLFLDALEADVVAWSRGDERGRVYRDYDLDDETALAMDCEFESWRMETGAGVVDCTVCGCCLPSSRATHTTGEPACHECATWAFALTGESIALQQTRVSELETDAHDALKEALTIFLTNPWCI